MATEFSNGTTIPHANGWDDLLTKLNTFLTTNADLVAGSQNWTNLADNVVGDERFVYLRGPGLAGTDEIHINIRRYEDIVAGARNWEVRYSTGYDSGLAYDNQPGVSLAQYFALTQAEVTPNIQYWFFANGRRFMVVAKISTVYLSMYAGLFLPYATPSEYPLPICVMTGAEQEDSVYNEGNEEVTGFFNPKSLLLGVTTIGSNSIRTPGGAVIRAWNEDSNNTSDVTRTANIWPNDIQETGFPAGATTREPATDSYTMSTNDDDSYTLLPFVIWSLRISQGVLGELDGVFWVSGRDNSAENNITIGADNYVCHQSANQSNIDEFAAFKIE